ncbi:MAG: sulfite reductase, partial [Parachlamydiaceae bacterium]|nr:sulfite reductase [Parachlamydiaceae bacterium]
SIASSMMAVGEQVHLTVSELQYETNGHQRHGICTHFLCQLAPLKENVVPIYLQASNGFTLPADSSTPIIMVGPGTGVAPFRAFLQERVAQGATGLNWLIFGECHQAFNFYYEDYWQELVNEGHLRLDTAFSRDQEHKIYVQHRLMEHGAEIFALLQKGAVFYVCGDAHRMAKDVDAALHYIAQKYGELDEPAAKAFIKQLKAEKRYLRDVY